MKIQAKCPKNTKILELNIQTFPHSLSLYGAKDENSTLNTSDKSLWADCLNLYHKPSSNQSRCQEEVNMFLGQIWGRCSVLWAADWLTQPKPMRWQKVWEIHHTHRKKKIYASSKLQPCSRIGNNLV